MAIGFATALRNARLDAITTRAGNAAKLRIYSGTRPATGGTATTLLAELICGSPFAPAASAGVLTVGSVTQDTSADNAGTATWYRVVQSDGTTHVMDGGVGAGDLVLNTNTIVAGGMVQVTSWTITEGNP